MSSSQETLQQERQNSINYSADLADHISLSMEVRAETALNLLPVDTLPKTLRQQQALVNQLHQYVPSLQSLVLLSTAGQVVFDSAGTTPTLHSWLNGQA